LGGSSARAFNAAIGLRKRGCDVKVVAAFPHYPHGKVSSIYRRKALKLKEIRGIKLIRVWIPALPHNSVVNRIVLHFSFIMLSLFVMPFVGGIDLIWAANPKLFSFFLAYSLPRIHQQHYSCDKLSVVKLISKFVLFHRSGLLKSYVGNSF